jgi:dihydroorotase
VIPAGSFGRLTDAPATLAIVGARVIDPASGEDAVRDLGIRDGVMVAHGDVPADAIRLDGRGLVVAPGFVDLHVHLREPGAEASETIASGTRAAARGGFTAICAMPNTEPPLDHAALLARLSAEAAEGATVVRFIAAASLGRGGERLSDLAALVDAGVVAASDDGAAVPDGLARTAFERCAALDLPLFEHAEDAQLAAGSVMRAGATATRLGLAGWPATAELAAVERDLALAATTGARLHLTHLSTAAALTAVRDARAAGVRVTCDVTPHHLALTDAWVGGDRAFSWDEEPSVHPLLAYHGSCRVNPPLSSREDALALLAALADGTIDAVATDHAPHPPERKLVPFGEAAPGLIGLETALSLGLAAVEAGALRLAVLLAGLSTGPARVIGAQRTLATGHAADLVAFDPTARWTPARDTLASRSANTPLLGRELPGVVRLTLAAGRITYRATSPRA